LSDAGLPSSLDVNLTIKNFTDHASIMNYIGSPDYQQNDDNKGICFAFAIEETVEDEIEVKMVFSGQEEDPETQSIPSQLNPVWDEFTLQADFDSFDLYT
jgi:hypothetical protein